MVCVYLSCELNDEYVVVGAWCIFKGRKSVFLGFLVERSECVRRSSRRLVE